MDGSAVAVGETWASNSASSGNSHDVFERQAAGAVDVAGDDECGDLDELAFASSGRASLLLGVGDVVGGGDLVAATRRQHGEEGVFDGEVGHGVSVRGGADARLSSR